MSDKSERTTLSQLTYVSGASHAKTSARQENEKASPAADPACGQNTRESFASYDPDSSSWRTSQASVFGGWIEFSETWPRSGMMRCGTAYRLPPSAPITVVTGSSSWPTPRVSDVSAGRRLTLLSESRSSLRRVDKKGRIYGANLSDAVKMWPTASALAQKKRLGCSVGASNPQGPGSLNPNWVEWLMGFPPGWTDLDASETP